MSFFSRAGTGSNFSGFELTRARDFKLGLRPGLNKQIFIIIFIYNSSPKSEPWPIGLCKLKVPGFLGLKAYAT